MGFWCDYHRKRHPGQPFLLAANAHKGKHMLLCLEMYKVFYQVREYRMRIDQSHHFADEVPFRPLHTLKIYDTFWEFLRDNSKKTKL